MSTREDLVPTEVPPTTSAQDGPASNNGDSEPEPTITEPQVPPTPEPIVPSFQGTRIEGRTPDEGSAYIKILEQTVQEQKDRLTQQATAPVSASAPEPEPEANFFDNPREVLRAEIARAVEPINREISAFRAEGAAKSVWTQIEQEIPDFAQFRPLVDQLIEGHGYKPADLNVALLRNLYYTAVGWHSRQGEQTVTESTAQPTPQPTTHIPQHVPSTAPLPKPPGDPSGLRELTENERRVAREWKMSPEEYLRLADENLELEGFSDDN